MAAAPAFPLSVMHHITPALLDSLFALEMPWPKSASPSVKEWFSQGSNTQIYKDLCWESLLALSRIPLPTAQTLDFFTLLPSPDDPNFPPRAIGLILLLDQAPRHLCTNLHERWRNAFFDPLALSFALALRTLPPPLYIHAFPRWETEGWTYEHFNVISNFLTAPFAHAEDLSVHDTHLLPEIRARRIFTAQHYHEQDAQHATPLSTLDFAHLIRARIPPDASFAEAVFWWCRVKEAHTPILRAFGRYPYRNRAVGRVSTPAEEAFLEETGYFGVSIDEEAAQKIRADVEKGVWTPLTE